MLSSSAKHYFPSRQTGQAAILPLILLAAMILVMYVLYNTGQITTNKIRLQNTADAAIFTLASFQSRDMNFKSYTNRAMVASHVAIGQMVGLSSWMRMNKTGLQNLSKIPYIGAFIAPFAGIASAASGILDQVTTLAITANNVMVWVLSQSQFAFSLVSGVVATTAAYDTVLVNDPKVNWFSIALNLDKQIKAYTENFIRVENRNAKGNGEECEDANDYGVYCQRLGEFREVTQTSRDSFSANRSYNWIDAGIDIGIAEVKIKIPKAGGTEFSKDFKTVNAIDTLDLEMEAEVLGVEVMDLNIPVGWGAAFANDDSYAFEQGIGCMNMGNDDRWGETWQRNEWASCLAINDDGGKTALNDNYSGFQEFYDLRDHGYVDTSANIYATFSKGGKHIRATNLKKDDSTLLGVETIDMDNAEEHYRGDDEPGITTLAKGHAYFSRPRDLWDRKDNQIEHGNLYNPFWQPQLVETTSDERKFTLQSSEK